MKWNDKGEHPSEIVLSKYGHHVVFDKNGCWCWNGYKMPNGYGVIGTGKREKTYAHRAFYEGFRGPIPQGLAIDHLCRNRLCVNPSHLEPVSTGENFLRGNHRAAVAFRNGTCTKGHPMEGSNLYITPDGSQRQCRKCRQAYYQNVTKIKEGKCQHEF